MIMSDSKEIEWETPQDLFDALNEEFHFTLDVCATPENTKCPVYFTKKDDGLKQSWSGICWMNPPYSRGIIEKWMKKAYEESRRGIIVVCLVPAKTDTAWFHDYGLRGEIRFIRGRLRFKLGGEDKGRANFPSAVIIFKPKL